MTRALWALLLLVATGCSTVDPERDPGRSATGPIFLVHGIWPDRESWWIDEMVVALRKRDLEAIPIPYATFVSGYVFDYGTEASADKIAEFERTTRALHRTTQCAVPLTFQGVGFSAGTAILMMATERGVTFEQVHFAGSPIPLFSKRLARAVGEERIKALINYYSPLDMITYVFLGSGAFGYHGASKAAERIENRRHWGFHIPPWTNHEARLRVVEELAALGKGRPRHTCFDELAFRQWYMAARQTLRD